MPSDFDFDRVLEDVFGGGRDFRAALEERVARSGRNPESSVFTVTAGGRRYEQRVYWVPVGKTVKRGEPIVSFDILTGDLLFVDRLTYNFFPPKVGQGFVFKTANIPTLSSEEGDKYYIKRLVGLPGDKLEIRAPVLYRNGEPITGSPAFAANANRAGTYPGYSAEGLLAPGMEIEVPPDSYIALGDNSPRSKDSRYWGHVPDKDVVGKPLLIYYPLTPRWGIPK
jgi:signal peptidase I